MFIEKILYSTIYFSIGFFIPTLTRFLSKFYPCSTHSFLGDIIKYYFNKKTVKTIHYINKYNSLKLQLFKNKLLWGFLYFIIFNLLDLFTMIYINQSNTLIYLFIYLFLLGFAANIDYKTGLIPDIITFPMLILGSFILIYTEINNIYLPIITTNLNGIISSLYIYILTTTLALIYYFKNPYSFGGGDVKLLSAIAILIGLKDTSIILIISSIITTILFLIKRIKSIKLAPIIFIAFLIWMFSKLILFTL